MEIQINTSQIISAVLIIGIIIFAGLYFTKDTQKCPEIDEEICSEHIPEINKETCSEYIPEEKAELKVGAVTYAINLYNESEMFFSYWVYNFGEEEAKNIELKCKLIDENNTLLTSETKDFGNLASQSTRYGELYTSNVVEEGEKHMSFCYIKDCDNCEILYKKIPGLVKSYEGEQQIKTSS